MRADGAETRERLLRCAREHYLEVGAANLSLREVARRAGVSAAAVYRHFEDKDALLGALVGEGFRAFYGYLMRSLAETSPLERLRAAGRNYLAFALENPEHYTVIFMRKSGAKVSGYPETGTTFQLLVDRVRECIDARVLRAADPAILAASIWAHVHGLASLRIANPFFAEMPAAAFARFFETSVDDHLRGLRP